MIKYENKTLNKNFKLDLLKKKTINNNNIVTSKNYIYVISLYSGYITEVELKAIMNILKKRLKGLAIIITNLVPSINITRKPLSVRMGKGKGKITDKKVPIIKGKILFKLKVINKKYLSIVNILFIRHMKFTSLKLKTIYLRY